MHGASGLELRGQREGAAVAVPWSILALQVEGLRGILLPLVLGLWRH